MLLPGLRRRLWGTFSPIHAGGSLTRPRRDLPRRRRYPASFPRRARSPRAAPWPGAAVRARRRSAPGCPGWQGRAFDMSQERHGFHAECLDADPGGELLEMGPALIRRRGGCSLLSAIAWERSPAFPYPGPAQEQRVGEAIIAEALAEARALGIEAEATTLAGSPAREIAAAAVRVDASMIVMGHRHLSWLDRLLHPSMCSDVLEHSNRPVVVSVDDGHR
jgi:nucleotide-binding universal stress UspA family protein